jgi:NADP-dependent 3-hydroxy acid dehydrogenase YdfG
MIEDKVVVITGASSGIGAATATLLAGRGAKVVLGARRKDRLDALAERLGAVSLPTDVRHAADVDALVRLARETHGRLDVLVGNAGIGPISPLDSLRVDDWDAMIDVNVKGVLHGIAAALPVFREQGAGQFVHTASTAAYRTVPTMAVYAATKAAVRTISEGLRQEAARTCASRSSPRASSRPASSTASRSRRSGRASARPATRSPSRRRRSPTRSRSPSTSRRTSTSTRSSSGRPRRRRWGVRGGWSGLPPVELWGR